jgi:hypothetical protein
MGAAPALGVDRDGTSASIGRGLNARRVTKVPCVSSEAILVGTFWPCLSGYVAVVAARSAAGTIRVTAGLLFRWVETIEFEGVARVDSDYWGPG